LLMTREHAHAAGMPRPKVIQVSLGPGKGE
jgi:hypothetical protein